MPTLQTGDRIPMSWEPYTALPERPRGEHIDGEFEMIPSPTKRHQDIEYRLRVELEAAVPPGVRVSHEWAWKPDMDEFIPDVVVHDDTTDTVRYTGTPHLVVEILSTERGRDLLRKLRKYAAAGLPRYWVVDPDGPEIIEYELVPGATACAEVAQYSVDQPVTLDIGVALVTLAPDALVE